MRRRDFLKQSALASGASMVPLFLHPTGIFGNPERATQKLVLIHLQGGNDGLNTVVPFTNDDYYRQRPDLAILPNEVIPLNNRFGFNPALRSLMDVYGNGRMLILNNVGFDDTERSHYNACTLWQNSWSIPADKITGSSATFMDCDEHGFDAALNGIASLIRSGDAGKIFHVSLDGFDTHRFQRVKQDHLLKVYADGLSAFIRELEKNGSFNNTLIVTYAEFGRSIAQNTAKGTDHGAGNNVFIVGNRLRNGGISAEDLDLNGKYIQHQLDFRNVYATILERWLHTKSDLVLGGQFNTMNWI